MVEMLSWDLLELIGYSIIFIGVFILAPILLVYWIRFLKIAKSVTIKHKHVPLINCIMVSSIFGLIVEAPFMVCCKMWKINEFIHISSWMISAMDIIYIGGIFVLYLIYLWLLFYYKQYHVAIGEITWKKAINARYRSWYILNKSKWGNFNYILKVILIPFIFYICTQFVIEYMLFTQNLSFHCVILLSLLFMIPSFLIYCKLRKYNDIFRIKKEVYYECMVTFIFMMIYLIGFIMEILTDLIFTDKYSDYLETITLTIQIEELILSLTTMIIIFFMSFILIKFSLNPLLNSLNPEAMEMNMMNMEKAITFSAESNHGNSITINSINHGINGMLEIIADNIGFKQYMQYLSHEYATENLLFILELIQIKYEFQMEHNMYMSRTATPQRSRANTRQNIELSHNVNMDNIVIEDDFIIDMQSSIDMDLSVAPIPETMIIDFDKELINDIGSTLPQRTTSLHTRASSVKTGDIASSIIHNSDGSIFAKIKLPSGLPRSELLNKKALFLQRLYELYLKYIKSGAIHEVNVSYYQRSRITESIRKMFENQQLQKLIMSQSQSMDLENIEIDTTGYSMFNIMDGACIEILMLMLDSYKRFILLSIKNDIQ